MANAPELDIDLEPPNPHNFVAIRGCRSGGHLSRRDRLVLGLLVLVEAQPDLEPCRAGEHEPDRQHRHGHERGDKREYGGNGLKGSKYYASQHGLTVKEAKITSTDNDLTNIVTTEKKLTSTWAPVGAFFTHSSARDVVIRITLRGSGNPLLNDVGMNVDDFSILCESMPI